MNKEQKTKYFLKQMNFAKEVAEQMANYTNSSEEYYITENIKKELKNDSDINSVGSVLCNISDKIRDRGIDNKIALNKLSDQLKEIQKSIATQNTIYDTSNDVKSCVMAATTDTKNHITLTSILIWLTVIIVGIVIALQSFDLTIDIKNPDPEQTIEVKPS